MAKANAAVAATNTAAPNDGAAAARADGAKLDNADVKQILTDTKPPLVPLLASEIWAREAGIKLNTWEAIVPVGTPWEHVIRPQFWANVARRMKMGDKIIVIPRDGAWYGELLVWDAGQNWAHVDGAHSERPSFESVPGVDSEFDIVTDPVDGVCVKRKGGAIIKKNLPNHEDARRWLLDHQKALRS